MFLWGGSSNVVVGWIQQCCCGGGSSNVVVGWIQQCCCGVDPAMFLWGVVTPHFVCVQTQKIQFILLSCFGR